MFDLYLSPILGQEHFTLEELGQIRMIKNKAHIIYYTKNISLHEAIKIILNKYYILNPLNAFEYIFINYQKKVEFQYLIDDVNNIQADNGELAELYAMNTEERSSVEFQNIDDIGDIDDIDDKDIKDIDKHLYQNNINNESVKEFKKHNDILVSIFNTKKKKKHNKNVIFNIEQNEIIEFDNGK